jgi:hypothetical protein
MCVCDVCACMFVCDVCVCVLVNSVRVGQTLTQFGEHKDAARCNNHKQLMHGDPALYSSVFKLT